MATLYHDKDRRSWVSQPQVTRVRMPYRGPRASYALNLEVSQVSYDIARLYKLINGIEEEFLDGVTTLTDGGTVIAGLDIVGLEELRSRASQMEKALRILERY